MDYLTGVGGRGWVLPYISHIGMYCPNGYWVWFLCCFGPKTGIDLAHFGLESGLVFKGTMGMYDCTCHFNRPFA